MKQNLLLGCVPRLLLLLCVFIPKVSHAEDPKVPDDVKAYFDLEYAQAGNQSLKLDLYVPKDGTGPFPVVVWFHSGGWRAMTKQPCTALPLVSAGYAVAAVEYQLTNVAHFPAQIEDCKAAIRWLRAHAGEYHLDKDRFGAFGQSLSGGYLASLVGTAGNVKEWDQLGGNADHSSRVQAVCEWYGPSDFHRAPVMVGGTRGVNLVAELLGDDVKGLPDPEKAKKASPINYVSHDTPPFLILHGEKDHICPLDQSEQMAAALKASGVDVTLNVLKDELHGIPKHDHDELTKDLVVPFFDKYLKQNPQ